MESLCIPLPYVCQPHDGYWCSIRQILQNACPFPLKPSIRNGNSSLQEVWNSLGYVVLCFSFSLSLAEMDETQHCSRHHAVQCQRQVVINKVGERCEMLSQKSTNSWDVWPQEETWRKQWRGLSKNELIPDIIQDVDTKCMWKMFTYMNDMQYVRISHLEFIFPTNRGCISQE